MAATAFREVTCPHRCGLSTAPMIFSRCLLDVANLNGVAQRGRARSEGEATMRGTAGGGARRGALRSARVPLPAQASTPGPARRRAGHPALPWAATDPA